MEGRRHTAFCALLQVAVSAVGSGLADVADKLLPQIKEPSPERVAVVMLRAISLRRDVLIDTAHRILAELHVDLNDQHLSNMSAASNVPRLVSAGCEVVREAGRGRHMLATRPICAGETVLCEGAAVWVALYPCGCSAEGTLMAEHLQMAWERCIRESGSGALHGRLRDTLCSGAEGLHSGRGSAPPNQWPLRTLLVMLTASYLCAALLRPIEEDADRLTMRLLDILSRLPQNTHSVDCVGSAPGAAGGGCTVVSQRRVAVALFTAASAMNHSCEPNCCVSFPAPEHALLRGGTVEMAVLAARDICPGEELTISYGVTAARDPPQRRASVLRSQYLFECSCAACVSTERPAAGDPSGDEVATASTRHRVQELDEMALRIERDIEMLHEERDDTVAMESRIQSAIGSLKERCAEAGGAVAAAWRARAVLLEARCLDACAFSLGMQSRFREAAEAVERALELLLRSKVFGERDVAVGRELVKLSELYAADGQWSESLRCARRAFPCLHGFVSDSDPDLLALLQNFPLLASAGTEK